MTEQQQQQHVIHELREAVCRAIREVDDDGPRDLVCREQADAVMRRLSDPRYGPALAWLAGVTMAPELIRLFGDPQLGPDEAAAIAAEHRRSLLGGAS